MKILLTNDDGIYAKGLLVFAREIQKSGHELFIFAPAEEHSGASHAITFRTPLKIEKVKLKDLTAKAYKVYGTPADCVRAAVHITKENFDFCFSGINSGYNAATNVLYSGTVSAAVEANLFNIPSMAASTAYFNDRANYYTCARVALEIFEKIKFEKKIRVINVNTPFRRYEDLAGIKVCKIGADVMSVYNIEENEGKFSMTLMGFPKEKVDIISDVNYLEKGYATISPLLYDLTNDLEIRELKELFE